MQQGSNKQGKSTSPGGSAAASAGLLARRAPRRLLLIRLFLLGCMLQSIGALHLVQSSPQDGVPLLLGVEGGGRVREGEGWEELVRGECATRRWALPLLLQPAGKTAQRCRRPQLPPPPQPACLRDLDLSRALVHLGWRGGERQGLTLRECLQQRLQVRVWIGWGGGTREWRLVQEARNIAGQDRACSKAALEGTAPD